jgi:hypothetical protein
MIIIIIIILPLSELSMGKKNWWRVKLLLTFSCLLFYFWLHRFYGLQRKLFPFVQFVSYLLGLE